MRRWSRDCPQGPGSRRPPRAPRQNRRPWRRRRQGRSRQRRRAKLGTARDHAVGDAGAEYAEPEQRQRREDERHRVVNRRLRAAEPLRELREQGRANADDDGEHQHLDAGRDDIADNVFGEEGGLAEEAEGNEHEAGERRELELDQRDENWMARMKKLRRTMSQANSSTTICRKFSKNDT